MIKKLRITIASWTDDTILATDGTVVANPLLIPTNYLSVGAELNLLLAEQQADGSLLPQHIVLDPDFLVDVTTICRCFTHHGDAPAMHLLQKFMPSSATPAILLGNAANQFLDDCVNAPADIAPESLYRESLRKTFCNAPLQFATTDGIDQQFSNQCHELFYHIWSVVHESIPFSATLESAFLCEALGIQGRMDMMSTDHRSIIELKSGKANEYGQELRFRYEHAMQMALYKESLYYNEDLPYAQVYTQLFYARYPELIEIHLGRNDIHRAMSVRNSIIHIEHLLQSRPSELFHVLSEQHFNVNGCRDRFYECYLRPSILQFLQGLHAGDSLTQAYFHTMLAFVEREQFLAKTGVEGVNLPAGHHGFADTWRTDVPAKLDSGRIIPDLRLTPVMTDAGVVALEAMVSRIDESSNFRVGDMVMLYAQNPLHLPSSFYISCVIEELSASSIFLRLRYPQHDTSLFNNPDTLFAIEPAHVDSGYTVLYRGLYAFLSTDRKRQQLLLGLRPPLTDPSISLTAPVEDPTIRDIILRAKQARDYYLLVGPPGTGKTSIALRQMVVEYLADRESHPGNSSGSADALLLMAFTNRAVDEICTMLTELQAPYLRLGPELSCAPDYRNSLLSAHAQADPSRDAIRRLLISTPIIVGTLSSISSSPELFRLKHFRASIIDEASQALEPHSLPLLCATDEHGHLAIDKFILIGDHKQLPAVVAQSSNDSAVADESLRAIGLTDCRRSLFERLHGLALQQGVPAVIGTLKRQGRMHEDIAAFVNHHFYDGLLEQVPLPHQAGPLSHSILSTQRMCSMNIPICSEQCTAKSNYPEAQAIARLVSSLATEFQTLNEPMNWLHRLGIIVPFRGQITLIRRALEALHIPDYEQITIDTVERYQGSQRDYILFSTTVTTPRQLAILSQPVSVEGNMLDRKLNVALTRARLQFILIGNYELLRTCEPYRQLLDEMTDITAEFESL